MSLRQINIMRPAKMTGTLHGGIKIQHQKGFQTCFISGHMCDPAKTRVFNKKSDFFYLGKKYI